MFHTKPTHTVLRKHVVCSLDFVQYLTCVVCQKKVKLFSNVFQLVLSKIIVYRTYKRISECNVTLFLSFTSGIGFVSFVHFIIYTHAHTNAQRSLIHLKIKMYFFLHSYTILLQINNLQLIMSLCLFFSRFNSISKEESCSMKRVRASMPSLGLPKY